jgi:hypothetical protein
VFDSKVGSRVTIGGGDSILRVSSWKLAVAGTSIDIGKGPFDDCCSA